MKTVFEPSDLVGDRHPFILGRIVRRGPKDEHWIVSYDPSKDTDEKYHVTSVRDGMMMWIGSSAESLCQKLNEGGFEIVGTFTRVEDILK
ncbi:hypothetical protein [Brevundimonas pondensis]|uniref:Uncharacterized protein n=1 Tax=Brevundimonas pondensis TaxID=2774189 RepID=A0ABX7SP06_9CAUL|nr:hypothetical protein [Brevundimonas pondensis]QTC88158.1 hypothetical protein IFE19_01760 [Brevundimonas pondensis]